MGKEWKIMSSFHGVTFFQTAVVERMDKMIKELERLNNNLDKLTPELVARAILDAEIK